MSNPMLKARTQLLFTHPFFATLILKLKFEKKPLGVLKFNTMATDGIHLFYTEEFANSITIKEIMGVLAHEALHCALNHPTRGENKNEDKWGKAIDYVVNPLVMDAGLKLPEGCLYDAQYRNMTGEAVYDMLPDPPTMPDEDNPIAGGPLPGQGIVISEIGEVLSPKGDDGKPLSTGEIKQLEGEWGMAVKQATAIAKQAGKMPANIEETITELNREPQVAWQEEFRYYMTVPAQDDYSWAHANRRFIYDNLYLPSRFSLSMGTLVWATDSSGSVTQEEFEAFGSEFNEVAEETQPDMIHFMWCDTVLHGIEEITPDQFPITKIKPIGRGGTKFDMPFQWVIDNGIRPDCLVYLTDLCGRCDAEEPDYPVLWINTSQHKGQKDVPFGKVITIKV